ncbi:carbohydrate esterase family 1 protein [Aaosphaeria arxii CBS 175.79]|uniref:feruloyl esterase n=1 Tax=Aaosphaeria arxii CBS 175.79 TaxID=1450172 RepID=A0A6A5X9F3_9PLEO|nr:carbohydrate esterase family 1 protein [Aaosphaeria arxii CBS 175.79]KAF2009598.1 carbohydrate esterase family 1 protein [Aaosphaeria arxii CBS 175.79]
MYAYIFAFLLLATASASPHALPRAESGCGRTQILPGITQYRFSLKSSGKDRSYSYHLPSNYDKNRRYPVVLGFHGSSSTGLFFELDTKMSETRFSGDKIMVYPNGVGGSWAGPTYHTDSTVDEDVQYVSDVVEDLRARLCVDEKRIYAAGMSNGGGFVGTLACSKVGSQLFAGFAASSGAFYTDLNDSTSQCKSEATVPILEIHGFGDRTVHYEGGQGDGGPLPSIPSWLDTWAQRYTCQNKTEEVTHEGDVHHYSWTCNGKAGLLQHYKVERLGHCWADTEINLSQISVPQGPASIKATAIIMEFFDNIER